MGQSVTVDIGVQSFEKIRRRKAFYIDKTGLIREWWEGGSDVTLLTRPRRFGKTLNMSMLECFFSNQYAGRSDLFEGLSVWEDAAYRQLQGTYPVIFMSFASVKAQDYKRMEYSITKMIADLYEQNSFLLEEAMLSENEKSYFADIKPGMDRSVAVEAVHTLSNFLSRYYDRSVIILLDEYDTPMQEAWLSGYWDAAVAFFRSFFNATFKTNPYMERALITGITRISKESIFSDLNNPDVITTTSNKYAQYFGFTEQEVFCALDSVGLGAEKQSVRAWYDGFTFGNVTDIYNPWSITNFIGRQGEYDTYWADSSGNGLVNSLIQKSSANTKRIVELLMQGRSFEVELDEQIVYSQIDGEESAIWSLLLATGYLKVCKLERKGRLLKKVYTLRLTNMEVESMFSRMIRGWFSNSTDVYNAFIRALMEDNVKKMNTFMNRVALNTFSFFDSANKPSEETEPERFYHGFVLGMVVDLADRYTVRSNRESGYGRYDVMIKPLDRQEKAFIFEFKVLSRDDDESVLEDTVVNALRQIEERQYAAELIAEGFAPENIRKYGFAFEGKRCLIG
ncbi:MAG: AAA family ATPase [Lachnospiraceae bacterium]|nr:AAA family ATPase [Lachnospiraceae bacterium]